MTSVSPAASLEELARMNDDDLDVELGAALVARDAYDALDVSKVLAELAGLGAPLATFDADTSTASIRERITGVSELFTALGFRGNTGDYYDPKNSLLPDVLSRKVGIPITLSIVWCAMAKRAGLVARGIAFPGHFLVRVDATVTRVTREGSLPPVIVDPFGSGRVLDEEATAALLRRARGKGAELNASLFAPANPRATLVRLLTNLEATYAKRGEHARAFVAVDRILTLVPDSAHVLRERAALALQIGASEVARADLSRVLELEPGAPDAVHLEARLAKLALAAKATLH